MTDSDHRIVITRLDAKFQTFAERYKKQLRVCGIDHSKLAYCAETPIQYEDSVRTMLTDHPDPKREYIAENISETADNLLKVPPNKKMTKFCPYVEKLSIEQKEIRLKINQA